ncbi:hypothetical protein ACIP9H_29275 [Streptomyces sp. NPDC088732]|uniref:hypothetical protein n=1 Tax=Streptomyces sp. NPDC088732 TaxID=3365879 RepID=UPI0038098407
MPETGSSWTRAFPAQPAQAREARAWATSHLAHQDTAQLAGELFVCVLATTPSKVTMTISTAGTRARITASGDQQMTLISAYGPGSHILSGLALRRGVSPDEFGLWAEVGL